MWVNKAERAWRHRNEAQTLHAVACRAEAHFAAFASAVTELQSTGEGVEWLARHGITSVWCARSSRAGMTGSEGLSVIEGVVLAGVCSRMLDDAAFVRWLSRASPGALSALHAAATGDGGAW